MSQTEVRTGAADGTFDLVSCVYHALDTAEICSRYLEDAAADPTMRQYFRDVIQANRRIAADGMSLLKGELGKASMDQAVDEASEESFPASDPPSRY
jgi:hypothetical protein